MGESLGQLRSKGRLRSRTYKQLRRLNTEKSSDPVGEPAAEMDGLVPGAEVGAAMRGV